MKRFFILCSFTFLVLSSAAQTRAIYQLKEAIHSSPEPAIRLRNTLQLCEQGYNLHADTLMAYAKKAEDLAKELDRKTEIVSALYYQCYALTNRGHIDSSLHIAERCLAMLGKSSREYQLLGNIYNQIGRCHMRKNQYKEAITMGYEVISNGEKAKNILLQMQGKTLIGWAYLEMGRNGESLKWHLNAMNTATTELQREQYGILFANISLNYRSKGDLDSAKYYIEKAVNYSRKHENLFSLSNSLAIQSELLIRRGTPELAETSLKEAVEIRKLIGDPFYIVSDMAQLGLFYAHNSQPDKGIEIVNEGIELARRYNIETKYLFLYNTLAENYKAKNDLAGYARTLETIVRLKDTVYMKNSAEALAELQANYELQKKENTIILQKLNLTRKTYFIYASLLFSCLLILSALLVFRSYRRRQKLKMEMILREEKRKAESAVKEAEENERRRIAADLHDNVGAYAASLASNIDYLQLNNPGKANAEEIAALRDGSQSIITQLNDTIWVLKRESLTLTAISDKLKTFIRQIKHGYPEIQVEIDESIDIDYQLPPSQAFHLYRIVQEAINNALKHSGGSHVLVKIVANAGWSISVSDNGKGISGDGAETIISGNGISNMRSRCREADWDIEWAENENGGTLVIISPTTN